MCKRDLNGLSQKVFQRTHTWSRSSETHGFIMRTTHEIWIVGIDEGAKPGEDDEDAGSTNAPPSNKQIMSIISRSLLVAVRESGQNLRM